ERRAPGLAEELAHFVGRHPLLQIDGRLSWTAWCARRRSAYVRSRTDGAAPERRVYLPRRRHGAAKGVRLGMIISTAVATLKKRLAYATGARDAWQGSGERLKYLAACARL